jgi:hypothetical protein
MVSHEGPIDTATKTAGSGCIQRQLVRASEDIMVCYCGTVRNSLGDLTQFTYRKDGMDDAFIGAQYIKAFGVIHNEFEYNYWQATFASHRVLEQFHPTRGAFDWVLGELEARFNESLANSWRMCGTLCAVHRKNRHVDDAQHIPLCWCLK